MSYRAYAIFPLIAVFLSLTACSAATRSAGPVPTLASLSPPAALTPASTGPGGACGLITPGDVATAFGRPFDTAKPGTAAGQATCLYEQSVDGTDTVTLVLVRGALAGTFYDTNRAGYPSTDVSGIGDRAWVADNGGAGGIMKSTTTVVVHDVGFSDIPPVALQAKVKAFEQILAARLP